jgi:hypothetical protein
VTDPTPPPEPGALARGALRYRASRGDTEAQHQLNTIDNTNDQHGPPATRPDPVPTADTSTTSTSNTVDAGRQLYRNRTSNPTWLG